MSNALSSLVLLRDLVRQTLSSVASLVRDKVKPSTGVTVSLNTTESDENY